MKLAMAADNNNYSFKNLSTISSFISCGASCFCDGSSCCCVVIVIVVCFVVSDHRFVACFIIAVACFIVVEHHPFVVAVERRCLASFGVVGCSWRHPQSAFWLGWPSTSQGSLHHHPHHRLHHRRRRGDRQHLHHHRPLRHNLPHQSSQLQLVTCPWLVVIVELALLAFIGQLLELI